MKRVLALTWFTRLFFLHERMGSVDDHMQTRNFTAADRKLGRAGNETNPAYTQRIGVCSYWRIQSSSACTEIYYDIGHNYCDVIMMSYESQQHFDVVMSRNDI